VEERSAGEAIKVRYFAGVRDLFGEREVALAPDSAPSVEHLLGVICDSPERRRGLLDDSGVLRKGIVILINGRSIAFLGGMKAVLRAGDVISVFPPVYGG
jgi:molybdopterin synthase sulfur carrier subunit